MIANFLVLVVTAIVCSGLQHFRKIPSLHQPECKHQLSMVTDGVIVGAGRIGQFLYESNGKKDLLLSDRSAPIPEGRGPIYVCTRNNDLDSIIAKTPSERLEDLVFLQNGVLTNYLKSKGLEENTQALIYLAVSSKGAAPIDGKTDLNPEGLTAVTGKWATDFANRLHNSQMSCHVLEKKPWMVAMLEKHIWICAFMAVGTKHGCTVGDVEKLHASEVKSLIQEMASAASQKTALDFSADLPDRLSAYARSVAHFPTALKEFEWRNGWFTDITFDAVASGIPDPCSRHTAILKEVKPDLLREGIKSWGAGKDLNAIDAVNRWLG